MKFHKLIVPVAVTFSLSLVPVLADGVTDGSIPCSDVVKNGESYGCAEKQVADVSNKKMACIGSLKPFQKPTGSMAGEGGKYPSKIMKDEHIIAIPHQDGSLSISDKLKDYKLDKEDIKKKILQKLGDSAANTDEVSLAIMTANGKIKIKAIKDKFAQGEQAGDFQIGSFEKLEGDFKSTDKEVLITLGNSHSDSNAHNDLKEKFSDDVENFDKNIRKEMDDLEKDYTKKVSDVDQAQELSGMEKVTIKRELRDEKEDKKLRWQRLLEQKERLRQNAQEACRGLANIVKPQVLEGSHGQGGGKPGRNVASTRGSQEK